MKIDLCLIALLWSMHVSIYAADGVTSFGNNQEGVAAGSGAAHLNQSALVAEQGVDGQSKAADETLGHSLTVHPAFYKKRDAQTADRYPISTGKIDPEFGATRTASGTLFESESSSEDES